METNQLCSDQPCNMIEGHPGSHGMAVGDGGLILAPRSNAGAILEEAVLVDLDCDSCHAPMKMTKRQQGGSFQCTVCRQRYTFSDRGITQLLVTLFPSEPIYKMNRKMQEDYIRYERSQMAIVQRGNRLLGLISDEEYEANVREFEQSVKEARDEIARWNKRSFLKRLFNKEP